MMSRKQQPKFRRPGSGKALAARPGSQIDSGVVLQALQESGSPLRLDDLLGWIGAGGKSKKKTLDVLAGLLDAGELVYLPGGRYALPSALKQIVGQLQVQRAGMGFVSSKDPALKGQDVYVSSEYLGLAWHGDTVRVALLPDRRGKSPEGIVLGVVDRKIRNIMVQVVRQSQPGEMLCSPLDQRQARAILVDVRALENRPLKGDVLNVRPAEHLEHGLWRGAAIANLGSGEDVPTQEAITKLGHNIPQIFPDDVLDEAGTLPEAPEEEDFVSREDLRHLGFVTIDGVRAKDFDDAVYVEKNGPGFVLYVSIADVTHYVRPGTALDREAALRGNSYYFAQSAEPMLPDALSSGLCSLRPGVNRLCATVRMEFSPQGKEAKFPEFCFSVIRSRARLTYDSVFRALEEGNAIDRALLGETLPMLESARELALILQAGRRRRGALFLDLPETEAMISKDGKVEDIYIAGHNFAHQMIEEFMVAANEAVAEHLAGRRELFPYRIHPYPDPEKLAGLFRTLSRAGLVNAPLPSGAEVLPALVLEAREKGCEFAVSNLVLRAMMQARYSIEPDIHFGLASECYCHFTSPIRRYADVLVHRALRAALGEEAGGRHGKRLSRQALEELADSMNASEKQAKDAELELDKRLGVLFMRNRIGEKFKGLISGITDFGIFVQLEHNLVEGMVRLGSIDDKFIYFPERQELLGQYTRKRFALWQELEVRVVEVHISNLEITFELTG